MSDLQFDKAEYADPAAASTCVGCQGALSDAYFAVGDRILCRGCAEQLRVQLANQGSRPRRVVRAAAAGLGAAALGSLLYWGVLALTGYEFGLIAIVVGYAVGVAVRWGSMGRGGWGYQTLAIVLTYLSIVGAYIPPLIQGIRKANVEQTASAGNEVNAQPAGATVEAPSDAGAVQPTAGQIVFALALILAIACAAPFLAGMQNIIGLVIIGIGLYEAWKLNRRVSIEITGPHPVAAAASA